MHEQFIADIIEYPDDDATRLIYADWLDEQGEYARAEFIRVQCELAAAPRNDSGNCSYCGVRDDNHREGCRAGHLCRREKELCPAHSWDWIPPEFGASLPGSPAALTHEWPRVSLVGVSGNDSWWLTFRRGFISSVSLTFADWYEAECHEVGCYPGQLPMTSILHEVCPRCGGTGRVVGYGPSLVRAAPLEEVLLTGKTPQTLDGSFWWAFSEQHRLPSELPRAFAAQRRPPGDLRPLSYDSRLEAFADASRLCLSWAKSQQPSVVEAV